MPDGSDCSPLGPIGEDRLLDGRLILNQPRKGHRAGSDAILLAAALPALGEGPLLDMGAGVGTVGLAAALLQPALHFTLAERDPDLAALARKNVAANGLAGRARVLVADVEASDAVHRAAGLEPGSFACVAMNPPFYTPGEHRASPVPNRRAAHVADGALENWLRTARRLLRPGGRVVIIHRAEALADVLAGLSTGFGGVAIRPIHALPERPAIRVVFSAVLNSKRPAVLLPAFVLNNTDGGLTAPADALHRGQARLAMEAG